LAKISKYTVNYIHLYRSCYIHPMKCSAWVLTREWALAQDTGGEFSRRKLLRIRCLRTTCESFLHEILGMPHPPIRDFKKNSVKVFSMKCSLPTDPRKFSPSNVSRAMRCTGIHTAGADPGGWMGWLATPLH
jgi:hypothetical protein